MNDQQLVDKLESVWSSIAQLCRGFSEKEWKTPNDCPRWSVQDHVSHIVGTESWLLGRPTPDHKPRDMSHVKNEVGTRNEVVVDWRRPWPGTRVLDEFREVTSERLCLLRASGPDYFDAETATPIGSRETREFIRIHIFDSWVHEQDIRHAISQPENLEGPGVEHSMGRLAMTYIIGKKAQDPDGASVVFVVTGGVGRVLAIVVEGKRTRELGAAPASPTVRLTMNVETFACLGCGRWDPGRVLSSEKVRINGDRTLGETIVKQMNFMI